MARVCVAVAVYNGEATLGEALDSALGQTYRDFSVLVLDDGSEDRSAEIAQGKGCQVISQPNQGLGAARMRLIEEADGEFVAFLDHDDFWTPDKLEKQVSALDQTGAAMVHSDCWYCYDDGRVVPRDLRLSPEADAFDHILPNNRVIASSAVFRREAMLAAGNFVAETVRCSDWYGWFLLASAGKFVHLPEEHVRYSVRVASLANAGYLFHDAQRKVLEEHILPRFEELFARVEAGRRERYRATVERDIGLAMSSMAKHLAQQGLKDEARALHREALRRAPGVARVWGRAIRGWLER